MTSDKLKCVGGSQHGKRVATPTRGIEFPVQNERCDFYGPGAPIPMNGYGYMPGFRIERYEKHRLGLGASTSITVLRLEGMGDDEFYRRVADLIEL